MKTECHTNRKHNLLASKINSLTSSHLLLFIGFLPILCGCDDRPERVTVSGTVLVDGEPLKHGSVRFVPEGQRPSAGKVDESGRFKLTCFDGGDGTVLGTHRVQVSARDLSGKSVTWYAPNKYSDFRTSGITVEITEPVDDLVIELTWDGEKKPRKKKR